MAEKSELGATFKNFSEGVLNLAKCIALLAIGIWTVYQWDRVIFPKESHEDFVRRSAERTDVHITNSLFSLSERTAESTEGQSHQLVVAQISIDLENSTDFPISISGDESTIDVFSVDGLFDVVEDQGVVVEGDLSNRQKLLSLPLVFSDLSGRPERSPSVLEANGKISLGVEKQLLVERNAPVNLLTFEFRWTAELQAIDPSTRIITTEEPKRRHLSMSQGAKFAVLWSKLTK